MGGRWEVINVLNPHCRKKLEVQKAATKEIIHDPTMQKQTHLAFALDFRSIICAFFILAILQVNIFASLYTFVLSNTFNLR